MLRVLLVLAPLLIDQAKRSYSQTVRGVEAGFPEAWDGDEYRKELCLSRNIPEWLDGYFLIQTSAAYGKRTDPVGKKLVHMFDGLGAVASLELSNGQVKFSGNLTLILFTLYFHLIHFIPNIFISIHLYHI